MKYLLLIILAILAPAIVPAGITGGLKGTVLDTEMKPVQGATVRVMGTTRGAYSKRDGNYTVMNIAAGSYDIRISYIGYQDTTIKATIPADSMVTLHIRLRKRDSTLSEQAVTSPVPRPVSPSPDRPVRERLEDIVQTLHGGINGFRVNGLPRLDSIARCEGWFSSGWDLSFSSVSEQEIKIGFFNLSGEQVLETTEDLDAGTTVVYVPDRKLPPGSYTIRVNGRDYNRVFILKE